MRAWRLRARCVEGAAAPPRWQSFTAPRRLSLPPRALSLQVALNSGLLQVIADRSSGYLPPGTKVNDVRVQGALIAVGLWTLTASLAGLFVGGPKASCARQCRLRERPAPLPSPPLTAPRAAATLL